MSELVIRQHGGLGDMLITNAIVRDRAAKFARVYLPCKTHNVPSVAFMFRDLPNVELLAVKDDYQASLATRGLALKGVEVLGLGMFGEKPFNINRWDEEMYRQAGVPFQDRWDKFHVERCPSREKTLPKNTYWVFCHDDPTRRFTIASERLPKGMPIMRPLNPQAHLLFDFWGWLAGAQEIHCVDSAFGIWAQSIPTAARRKVLHLYARPNAKPPQYRKDWEILR